MVETIPGSNHELLRDWNIASVLSHVRALGASARIAEIAELSGLSLPTVRKALAWLIEQGLVTEQVRAGKGRGRPARTVSFQPEARLVAAIDAGPHRIAVHLGDLDGRTVSTSDYRSTGARTAMELIRQTEATLDDALDKVRRPRRDLAACVVGVPGVIDSAGRLQQSPAIRGLSDVDVAKELSRLVGCPLAVENDVNLAVVAEHRLLGDDGATVVLIHWGTRVGAGLVISGRLHRGTHGSAGEIGYFDLDRQPAFGGRGELGKFEEGVSLPHRMPAGYASVADWLAGVRSGTRNAAASFDRACKDLARGVAPLLLTLDPSSVVLGGPAVLAGEVLAERLSHHLQSRVLVPPAVLLSRLGEDAVAQGAMNLARATAERQLLGRTRSIPAKG